MEETGDKSEKNDKENNEENEGEQAEQNDGNDEEKDVKEEKDEMEEEVQSDSEPEVIPYVQLISSLRWYMHVVIVVLSYVMLAGCVMFHCLLGLGL